MNAKKIVVCLFSILVASSVFSQKITGFGEYKIGMSSSEFLSLDEIKILNLKDKIKKMYVPDGGDLWKTTSDSDLEAGWKVYSPEVIKFEFNLATGIENGDKGSYRAEILLYKNKLVNLIIFKPPTEFEKILTEKYGKPKHIDKTKKVVCQNGYGAKTEHFDGLVTEHWADKGDVIAELEHAYYDCGKVTWGYTVKNKNTHKILTLIEENGLKSERSGDAKLKAAKSKL